MPIHTDRKNTIHPVEDCEVPGILYASPATSDGEIELYVVLQLRPRKVLRFKVPDEYFTEEVREKVDELVALTSRRTRIKLVG